MASPHYEIRVAGVLPPEALLDFEQLSASVQPVETVLHGPLRDPAALHGLLARLETLGVQVLEIRRLQDDAPPPGELPFPDPSRRVMSRPSPRRTLCPGPGALVCRINRPDARRGVSTPPVTGTVCPAIPGIMSFSRHQRSGGKRDKCRRPGRTSAFRCPLVEACRTGWLWIGLSCPPACPGRLLRGVLQQSGGGVEFLG